MYDLAGLRVVPSAGAGFRRAYDRVLVLGSDAERYVAVGDHASQTSVLCHRDNPCSAFVLPRAASTTDVLGSIAADVEVMTPRTRWLIRPPVLLTTATFPRNVHTETTQSRMMTSYSDRIRALALSFPATYEDSPWGFPVFKVADNKLFAMMTQSDDECECELTVKLTSEEREVALMLPNVRRASYVGRYGWVTATITDEESLQAGLEWMRESYWLRAPMEFRSAVTENVDDDARKPVTP